MQNASEVNKEEWNEFIMQNGPRSGRFLHSWGWGEFKKVVGDQVDRIIYKDDEKLIGLAVLLNTPVPGFGKYIYVPRGPVILSGQENRFSEFVRMIESPFFVRVDSAVESESFNPNGFQKTYDAQPANTLITNLFASEEELQASMHSKTRYNIRLADKHGVHVRLFSKDFDGAWSVFEQTGKRGQFRLHAKAYYRTMLNQLNSETCRAFLAVATFEQRVVAANIMIDCGNTRTYLHGASSNSYRNIMAPYLLHWELMRDAMAKDIQFYDWWGVAPMDKHNHPWAGVSRFKRGFGGEEVSYPGTYDDVRNNGKYWMYRLVREIRRSI